MFNVQRDDNTTRNGMMVRADARAIGMVTATRVGGTRSTKVYSRASECISYYMDDKSDAVIFRESSKNRRVRAAKNLNIPAHRITAADLKPIFAD